MRGSFLDFTRGSQVAETVGMMFTTALRPMFWTVVGILLAALGYQVWHHTDHGDRYFWMMHSYADIWHYFNFNPSHLIGLKMVAGDTVRVPISLINSYPPLIAAWARLTTALTNGTVYGLGLGIPLAIIATIGLRRFGHDLTERKHTRGATIASVPELQADVATLNAAASAADSRKIASDLYGKSAPLKLTIPANRRHVRSLVHEPYQVAGIPYPWRAEQSHTMIVGTTGTGKSTAMKDLLRQIKARGDRAVVFDLTGTYVEGFYNKKTDVLLNPFDVRCPAWSPFADARTREHFKEVSQALIPMTENGDSFWQETARMLFVETCVRLVEQGNPGMDLTFSAPKSLSMLAYVAGDTRLLEANMAAVKATLKWAEANLAETRIGAGGDKLVKTGNLLVALFQHDTSRNLDPQAHVHAVIANATQTPDGKWQALHNVKLWTNNTLLGSIYHAYLREGVTRLGYAIGEIGKHGSFEIAGVDREAVETFSTRRAETATRLAVFDTLNMTREEERFARFYADGAGPQCGRRVARAYCRRGRCQPEAARYRQYRPISNPSE